MALKSQGDFGGGYAAAVVGNADFGDAALPDGYGDAGGAGVQGVFQQFFDNRSGAFNHFAGGDLRGDIGGELPDGQVRACGHIHRHSGASRNPES